MDPQINPFAALSLIAAPAVLTNASSVLTMGTGNRLARAVDRGRQLIAELERPEALTAEAAHARVWELKAIQQRTLLLIRALRCFYLAIGGFAGAALLSLIGSALASAAWARLLTKGLEVVAIAAGFIAVVALIRGALLLVRETQIAVRVMEERAAWAQEIFAEFEKHQAQHAERYPPARPD
jgi:hypothetical protein